MPLQSDPDYVVVGSGPGGGTVAARLAEAGHRVVLLEAGGDPRDPAGTNGRGLPADYDIPAFHPFATEADSIAWHFFVRHWDDDAQQAEDPAYRTSWDGRPVDGVLYPRASCLGGCAAHNALILVMPPDDDWNAIATATGDRSWRADNMARYFVNLENCGHRPLWRFLSRFGFTRTGHGFSGWLSTQKALPRAAFDDRDLVRVTALSAFAAFAGQGGRLTQRLRTLLGAFADPNDRSVLRTAPEGLFYTPLTTRRGARHSARERVRTIAQRWPDLLDVRLNCLATRVLFDGVRAVGVQYQQGPALYGAHRTPSPAAPDTATVHARREVILAGGAFNTPQLLMLSGIGDPAELARHGLPVRVALPGVGRNLQDRYELGLVHRMAFDAWPSLKDAKFRSDDRLARLWTLLRRGMYTSNGAGLTVSRRSSPEARLPDLFLMTLLGSFDGYYPGWSAAVVAEPNRLTWSILKAHTENRAGSVTLRSPDPRAPPHIAFRYFEEGSDAAGDDLRAVIAGIRLVRTLTAPLRECGLLAEELLPGPDCETDAQLAQFARQRAWGHHACGTCAIGPPADGGVLDPQFRVHGTIGLRVVDASVFPRIPGFFLAGAVYMIGEKAADAILAA